VTVVPAGGGGNFNAADALYAITAQGVTVTAMATAQLAILLDHYRGDALASATKVKATHALGTLRLVSCGGSSLAPELIQSLWAAAPRAAYFTDYGMTEACGRVCTTLVLPLEDAVMSHMTGADRARLLVRAGRAVPGVEVLVVRSVDDKSSPTASSPRTPPLVSVRRDGKEAGEVLIRGECVFKDYWDPVSQAPVGISLLSSDAPAEGRASFTSKAEGGWFRTGDAATVDPHGWVTVVDRIKDVIISGGENVFCPEVELVLREHPGVSQAAVYGVPDALLGELVEAAVTLAPPGTATTVAVTEHDLRAHCSASLAQFKVPHRIVVLKDADMPLTSTGKIQKRKLRENALAVLAALDAAAATAIIARRSSLVVTAPLTTMTSVRHKRSDLIRLIHAELNDIVPSTAALAASASADVMSEDTPLAQAGLHSTAAVALSKRLTVALTLSESLPSLLAFNHPTVGAIADFILAGGDGGVGIVDRHDFGDSLTRAGGLHSRAADIAQIICHSGVLPGGSAFRSGVGSGVGDAINGNNGATPALQDVVSRAPRERWDVDEIFDPSMTREGSVTVPFAAFLCQSVGACDADILGVGSSELLAMDPTHRILVEHSCYAMSVAQARMIGEGAATTTTDTVATPTTRTAQITQRLLRSTTSVYVGCMWSEYDRFLVSNLGVDLGASVSIGTGNSFMAGRVSYTLDLKGECAAVDTACSSSMAAVHLGCGSLGVHRASLASGVSMMISPATTARICQLGALSPTVRGVHNHSSKEIF